jgi:hypothetical protein
LITDRPVTGRGAKSRTGSLEVTVVAGETVLDLASAPVGSNRKVGTYDDSTG